MTLLPSFMNLYKSRSVEGYTSLHWALRGFREATKEVAGVQPLTRILAVGVPFNGLWFLRPRDPEFVGDSLRDLAGAHIPVSRDFVFTPFDLRYGRKYDYLDPANVQRIKPDIVIIAFIATPNHPQRKTVCDDGCFTLSPKDSGIASWQEATENSGAKIVLSYAHTKNDVSITPSPTSRYEEIPKLCRKVWSFHVSTLIDKDYAASLRAPIPQKALLSSGLGL